MRQDSPTKLLHHHRTMMAMTTLLALTLALLSATASASIEKEPVRVTHKNSGPKYDFDDVERTRLSGPPTQEDSSENMVSPPRNPFQMMGEPQQQQPSQQQQPDQQGDVAMPIGRVSIRRIFLVPMTAPQTDGGIWSQGAGSQQDDESTHEQPRLFSAPSSRPFWPFMAPPQPPSSSGRHHLLGGDEASRSPTPDSSIFRPSQVERPDGGEREEPSDRPRMMIDPIQMMMEMLQHALNPQMSPSNGGAPSFFKDLNKEASGSGDDDKKPSSGSSEPEGGLERPFMPSLKNETKEDVIEIDGKKYLRKTVINRHVGDNIIFMTKRLIFVPLNETTGSEESSTTPPPSTTTTTEALTPATNVATDASVPQSQTSSPQEAAAPTTTRVSEPKVEEAITSTTTTTTTTEAPTTVAREAPSVNANPETSTTTTTTATSVADSTAEETTPKGETIMERVSDAISRAVERLEERAGSSSTTMASP